MAIVLLVDDDDGVRAYLRSLLRRNGHTVTACSSGQEAIDRFGEKAWDVLVTDVQMPGMAGPELFRNLREAGFNGPTIFVTGNAGDAIEEVRTLCIPDHINWVAKPIVVSYFLGLVGTFIQSSRTS